MEIYYRDWLTGLWWQRRLSAGCRNQKAAGVIQSESEGLRLGGWWYNFLPKAQEPGIWMAQGQEKMWHSPGSVLERVALHLSSGSFRSGMEHRSPALQAESLQPGPPGKPKADTTFLYAFVLFRPSVDWVMQPWWERSAFSQFTNPNANLFPTHPRRHSHERGDCHTEGLEPGLLTQGAGCQLPWREATLSASLWPGLGD